MSKSTVLPYIFFADLQLPAVKIQELVQQVLSIQDASRVTSITPMVAL